MPYELNSITSGGREYDIRHVRSHSNVSILWGQTAVPDGTTTYNVSYFWISDNYAYPQLAGKQFICRYGTNSNGAKVYIGFDTMINNLFGVNVNYQDITTCDIEMNEDGSPSSITLNDGDDKYKFFVISLDESTVLPNGMNYLCWITTRPEDLMIDTLNGIQSNIGSLYQEVSDLETTVNANVLKFSTFGKYATIYTENSDGTLDIKMQIDSSVATVPNSEITQTLSFTID